MPVMHKVTLGVMNVMLVEHSVFEALSTMRECALGRGSAFRESLTPAEAERGFLACFIEGILRLADIYKQRSARLSDSPYPTCTSQPHH